MKPYSLTLKVVTLILPTYETTLRHLRHHFSNHSSNHHHTNRNAMTTHIIKRGKSLYLVEEVNSEFLKLTPLGKGEVFYRSIEDYYRTVNRFNTETK